MANLAETLRKEKEAYQLPQWLSEEVARMLRCYSRASFICDHHIREIGRDAFPMRYEEALKKWGRDNGFNVSYDHNYYGVRYICFSL